VINLRGTDPRAHYLFEEESCKILGFKLYNCRLWARRAAERENIIEVIDLMHVIERPFMFPPRQKRHRVRAMDPHRI